MIAIVITIIMSIMCTVPTSAASIENSSREIYYVVYDENGAVVEDGIILANDNARYSWGSSITLQNGWYTAFLKPGPESFYVTNGTAMQFSYSLNRNATIAYKFYQDSSPTNTIYSTVWKSGTSTGKSGCIIKMADKTSYYYVGITNASSDPITISNVSFVF